jgi:hypothetical protein
VIVDQELGEGLRERIRARTDPIPESLSSLVDQAEDVWAVMGTVRNRIAHGSDKQPRSARLGALTHLAHTVAVGAALNLLGVPDTVLCSAIDQDRWPVTWRYQVSGGGKPHALDLVGALVDLGDLGVSGDGHRGAGGQALATSRRVFFSPEPPIIRYGCGLVRLCGELSVRPSW